MTNYNILAQFYDELTENVEYEVRSDYISDLFNRFDASVNSIVDLACGTCSLTIPFVKRGIKLIGVDYSQEMLVEADSKLSNIDCDYELICAGMQDFVYPEGVDAVLCSLDSINHLTSYDDVVKTFNNVYNSLDENGIFIFDVNTIYKHQNILANNTFVFDEEDYFIAWDNEQIDDREIRILLDFFIYNGESYDRYSEEFCERAYSIDEIKNALDETGFEILGVYDELTTEPPKEDSQRLYFVSRRK